MLSQLRTALSGNVAGLSTHTTLGEVGFKTERDGTVTIDNAKLDTALANNYSATKALFITQPTSSGIADRVVKAVDFLDAVDTGAFTIRKTAITSQISQAHRRNRPQGRYRVAHMKNGCDRNSPSLDSTLTTSKPNQRLKALQ